MTHLQNLHSPAILLFGRAATPSYRQGFETIKPFKYKRRVIYQPFIANVDKPKGYSVNTERDSLITLVTKRDFDTINHLGDNQNISHGNYISIYVAYKDQGEYKIESCLPREFIIRDTYRQE